jgi:uncharacterized protein (TIGR00730 family)
LRKRQDKKQYMKRICVYCGSSPGAKNEYAQAARVLGRALAIRKIALVYGGAHVGIMGQIADACLDAGGEAIGVIPARFAEKQLAHPRLTRLHVVQTMHERKAMMAEMSDGFIALPGGLGTLEEFFEALTWAQLGIHRKPCGLLNTCRFYDPIAAFVDQLVAQRFLDGRHRDMIQIDENPESLLDRFDAYKAPEANKAAWVLQLSREAQGVNPPASGADGT